MDGFLNAFFPRHFYDSAAHQRAAEAKDATERQKNELRDLESNLERTQLVAQALWEICRDRFGITDRELLDKMQEVDLRDGTSDGKMTVTPTVCPQCSRSTNTRKDHCYYCGAKVAKPNVFE